MKNTTNPPLYLQIKNYILEKIHAGEWPAHSQIPSEAELVELFHTSRMTVNRAMNELATEERLIRRRGAGTFVATPKTKSAFLEISSIAEEIRKRGRDYSNRIHYLGTENATPEIAVRMELAPYTPLFHSQLVHKEENVPIQLALRYINPELAPEYLEQDFSRITPSEYLLEIMPVYSAEHQIEAVLPEKWIRDLLETTNAEPCLLLTRITKVAGVIATLSFFYYPGSRYSFDGSFNTEK